MVYKFLKKYINKILYSKEVVNNVVIAGYVRGIQNVTFEGENRVPNGCVFSGTIQVGYATTFGLNNYVFGDISIGKYCQIGIDVAIHSTNHPVSYLSTYINKNLFAGELSNLKAIKKITIGNDVWIGHGAIIVGSVNIGNGAIVAAGSIVTKDIEPYTIVAGSPAKEINKRFNNSIINELEELKWWDKSKSELELIKPLFFKDLKNETTIY